MDDRMITPQAAPKGVSGLPASGARAERANIGSFHPGGREALPQKLHLQVSTVNALLFDGDVQEVTLPGEAGSLGVLPGHDPMLLLLRSGPLVYRDHRHGEGQSVYVIGGLAEVGPGYVRVLADHAVHSDDADARRRAEAMHRAEAERPAEPRAADFAGIKAALDAELLRFFQLVLFGRDK